MHLARHTLLMEHVAGGTVACLCDITIYLLFWILFELRWKDLQKVCAFRHIGTASFFPFLPRSNFTHALRLDTVFYSLLLVSACWDLTCFERGRGKYCTGFSPRICMQRAENINRPRDASHVGSLLMQSAPVRRFEFMENVCTAEENDMRKWKKCCVIVVLEKHTR